MPIAPQQYHPIRAGKVLPLSATVHAVALGITAALSAMLITLANGETRYIEQGGFSNLLITITLFLSMAMLTLASISTNIRLGLQMVAVFFFMYLLLPGYHHLSINTFPFYNFHYSQYVLQRSSAIIFVFFVSFVAAYYYGLNRRHTQDDRHTAFTNAPVVAFSWPFSLMMLVISTAATVLLVRTLGVSGLLATRNLSGNATATLNASDIGLLVSLPRNLVFLAFFQAVAAVRYGDRRSEAWVWLALQVPLFLLSNWPLNLARYVLFGYALAIFVLVVPMEKIRMRVALSSLFIVGALFVMPFISAITRGGQSVTEVSFKQQMSNFLESGDFDGVQSINNAVIHVDRRGIAGGRQLLSDALFFVPRSVWGGKGEPSGSLAAKSAGYDFLNISMPLPGEVYIDFGWLGVFGGGLLLGRGLRRLDDWIAIGWEGSLASRVIGSLLVAFSIILLRGSILAVIGNIVLVILGALVVLRFGLRQGSGLAGASPINRDMAT